MEEFHGGQTRGWDAVNLPFPGIEATQIFRRLAAV
jgi:hypothetical protein